jgi:hypothetical protein
MTQLSGHMDSSSRPNDPTPGRLSPDQSEWSRCSATTIIAKQATFAPSYKTVTT